MAGGGGDMLSGWRGTNAGSMYAPTTNNLTDETVVGKVYDNRVVRRLLTYLVPYKRDALISIAAMLVYTAANVGLPLVIMFGMNWGINSGEGWHLHVVGLAFLGVAGLHFAANYVQVISMASVGQSLLYSVRTALFHHLQRLSPAFFHRTSVGRIMSRSQSDVMQLQETFELLVTTLADFLSLGGIIIAMLLTDWQLALVSLSIIPPLFFILGYWQRFARHSFMRIRRAIALVNGEYNQNITGVRVVQSLNRQRANLAHFNTLNQELLDANLEASRFSGSLQPLVEFLTGIGTGFGVILVGGLLLQRGQVEWGVLIAFALWVQRFFDPVRQLTMQYSQLQRAMAAGVRIFELLDVQPEVQDAPGAPEMPPIKGEIRFDHVSFHYVPGVEVLTDITLHIRPGEQVALVGSTGAGKSTLVNYFRFPYAAPRSGAPIALTTEIGDAPWAPGHKLVLIGARAKASDRREIEGRNLVLLLDVSGSMAPADKLPLIKSALSLFVDTLDPDDRLAIVTYAGTTGVALPSTPARQRDVIQRAIAALRPGGSTNGGQGLMVAYEIARRAFIAGGVNRVILATDGDFNVGIVSQHDLLRLIEHERQSGVFLSVFGVGTGNLKDSTMEMLADRGNGHYAYLDSLQEARRVLVREGNSTLDTVAKDVKFQVEFNPAMVAAWRQIGYENRALAAEDFNNDRKDAGEMGAEHTVTALYEIIPVGVAEPDDPIRIDDGPSVDPLRYQSQSAVVRRPQVAKVTASGEWLTVKARYKLPDGDDSRLITQPVRAGGRVQHLPLASAVAEFGMLLRDGRGRDDRWAALSRRISRLTPPAALAADVHEFAELVEIASGLARHR